MGWRVDRGEEEVDEEVEVGSVAVMVEVEEKYCLHRRSCNNADARGDGPTYYLIFYIM